MWQFWVTQALCKFVGWTLSYELPIIPFTIVIFEPSKTVLVPNWIMRTFLWYAAPWYTFIWIKSSTIAPLCCTIKLLCCTIKLLCLLLNHVYIYINSFAIREKPKQSFEWNCLMFFFWTDLHAFISVVAVTDVVLPSMLICLCTADIYRCGFISPLAQG